jgi:BMFP domain-containing protein YqiC
LRPRAGIAMFDRIARRGPVQTSNRLLDDFARLVTDATGAAQGIRREVETVVKAQIERLMRDMDVATREEVEVLRDLVSALRAENADLATRVAALENKGARGKAAAEPKAS